MSFDLRLMEGYWAPVTGHSHLASIDWCEINYQYSPYIVEFWNCLSSFTLVALGVYDYITLSKSKARSVELLVAILFIVVGSGSAAFHGTLKFNYQLWDELPMFWVMSA